MTQIMYVCDLCAESNSEGCGHYDRADLRAWPGDLEFEATTLCECCWDDWKNWHGNLDARPEWAAMPMPVEMVPAVAATSDFEGWWNTLLIIAQVSGFPVNHTDPEAYRPSFDEGMTPYRALQADADHA